MFDEEEIGDMLDLVELNMLHYLQRALFDGGDLQTLKWRDKSLAMCLLT